MKTLKIDIATAKELYKDASPALKKMIEKTFVNDFGKKDDDALIKTFAEACKKLKKSTKLPDVSTFPKQYQKTIISYYKLSIITEALNGDWIPDFTNSNQAKYHPWFKFVPASGWAYFVCDYWHSHTCASARLCFKSEALAKYAAEQFQSIYNDYLAI
jgi:hypothetical protein